MNRHSFPPTHSLPEIAQLCCLVVSKQPSPGFPRMSQNGSTIYEDTVGEAGNWRRSQDPGRPDITSQGHSCDKVPVSRNRTQVNVCLPEKCQGGRGTQTYGEDPGCWELETCRTPDRSLRRSPGCSPLPSSLITDTCGLVIPAEPLTLSEPQRIQCRKRATRRG